MKANFGMLKLFILLGSVFAATGLFGGTTYTWTGLGDGVTFDSAANWTPAGGPPGPQIGDTAQWDGLTGTNLVLNYTGTTPSFFGNPGINFILTARQTNSVTFTYFTPGGAAENYGLNNITVNGPGGAFDLGDPRGTTNNAVINIIARPNGATHDYVNNSTNPAVIYPNVRWQAGGGAVYTLLFDGTGDWLVTNDLRNAGGTGTLLAKAGSGTWVWNGPSIGFAAGSSTINSPMTISGGTLILKWGISMMKNVAIQNNALLEYDAPTNQTLNGIISGTGNLQVNNGTLTLGGQNTYTGTTTVSNGTLFINSGNSAASTTVNAGTLGGTGTLSGPVTLAAGTTLAPGASTGSVGTLTISNNLSIGGNLAIEVNKSLASSNDFVMVTGTLTNTGTGILTVSNLGPALNVGDKFTLFSLPVQNGAALTVTGAGVIWGDNLAVDGSIIVLPLTLNFTQTGNSLQFSWNTNSGSFKLQSQTNSLASGLNTNWVDYPGGTASPVIVSMDAMQETVFFRLVSAP